MFLFTLVTMRQTSCQLLFSHQLSVVVVLSFSIARRHVSQILHELNLGDRDLGVQLDGDVQGHLAVVRARSRDVTPDKIAVLDRSRTIVK